MPGVLSTRRNQFIALGAAIAFIIAAAAGTSFAVANNSDDQPLTGDTYQQAVDAALAEYPGAEVTETEIGDGAAAYEVELSLADGSEVEVELDDSFQVIGSSPDDDDGTGHDDDDDGDEHDDD